MVEKSRILKVHTALSFANIVDRDQQSWRRDSHLHTEVNTQRNIPFTEALGVGKDTQSLLTENALFGTPELSLAVWNFVKNRRPDCEQCACVRMRRTIIYIGRLDHKPTRPRSIYSQLDHICCLLFRVSLQRRFLFIAFTMPRYTTRKRFKGRVGSRRKSNLAAARAASLEQRNKRTEDVVGLSDVSHVPSGRRVARLFWRFASGLWQFASE